MPNRFLSTENAGRRIAPRTRRPEKTTFAPDAYVEPAVSSAGRSDLLPAGGLNSHSH